jgi:NAD(P)H dehydrogenase (quinone)
VVLCHPAEHSFNSAVALTYCKAVRSRGHKAVLRDLYRVGFDPLLKADERPSAEPFIPSSDVETELALLDNADVIVLVYPIWFGTPPAMMKGYVERVLGAGFGHRSIRERANHERVGGKHLVSITTSGNSIQWLHEQGAWLSLRNVFDAYLARAFSMLSNEHLHLASIVENMSPRHVAEELYRVTEMALATCARLNHVPSGQQAAHAL